MRKEKIFIFFYPLECMLKDLLKGARAMIKRDKIKLKEKLPEGLYPVDMPPSEEFDYALLVKTLGSREFVRAYEFMSGIKIPEKYKKGL